MVIFCVGTSAELSFHAHVISKVIAASRGADGFKTEHKSRYSAL